jgi:hypothetical protein
MSSNYLNFCHVGEWPRIIFPSDVASLSGNGPKCFEHSMPTPHETILAALRGETLPECVPADGLRILRDGEPEVTLSPLRYHYDQRRN